MKRKRLKKFNRGGLLRGRSHAEGGMPAIIDGREPVELEGGEYIIRKDSVQKYGEGTIARINQGLVNPNALRKLQNGGMVGGGMNNPIIEVNLQAERGQFVYQHNGQPYMGPYHIHQDGTYMIGSGTLGVNHEIKSNEVIVSNLNGRDNMPSHYNRNRGMRQTRTRSRIGSRNLMSPTRSSRRVSSPRPTINMQTGRTTNMQEGRTTSRPSRALPVRGGRQNVVTRGSMNTTPRAPRASMNTTPRASRQMSYRQGGKVGSVPNPKTGKFEHGGSVHTNTNTNMNMAMCFEGTGNVYSGMTVSIGGVNYTTKGGTLEGNSRKLGPCR